MDDQGRKLLEELTGCAEEMVRGVDENNLSTTQRRLIEKILEIKKYLQPTTGLKSPTIAATAPVSSV